MRSVAQFCLVMLALFYSLWWINIIAAFLIYIAAVPLLVLPIAWYVLFTLPAEIMDRHHETVVFAAQQASARPTPIERDAFLR